MKRMKRMKYFQIKYTYKHYNEGSLALPKHEYELYKRVLLWNKFISINYHPVPNVPIIKEVIK